MNQYKLLNTDFSDIITTCIEGGSNYWIDGIEAKDLEKQKEAYKITSNWFMLYLELGGTLILETLDGKEYLSYEDLKEAEILYKEKTGKDFDMETYDAGDADSFLQLAIFGELVYN